MIKTGFPELDFIIDGLKPGEITVIAGRPCMGKTTLCWSMAENIVYDGKKALIVAQQNGYIGTHNLLGIDTFDYFPSLVSFEEIRDSLIKNHTTGERYDAIFFTALSPTDSKEAINIYSSLKAFAFAENIAVIIEAAVDRKVENLENRRPRIEHLKYGKLIDKFIDNILFVYREGYYNSQADNSELEVIAAKNSSNRCGTAMLRFEVDEVPVVLCVPKIKNK